MNKKFEFSSILFALAFFLPSTALLADDGLSNKKGSQYRFQTEKQVANTAVRNQMQSGTCWCFSSNSFLESELIRMGKDSVNLSEMFVSHNIYLQKAKQYLRFSGKVGFGEGGELHDVLHSVQEFGIVPQYAYSGLPEGTSKINFAETDAVLKAILDAQLQLREGKLHPNGWKAFEAVLDAYMGTPPATFDYKGKSYTPISFRDELGIKAENYVYITSFSHHPFYEKFILEVPDNWALEEMYNVPLDELEAIVKNAIRNEYTVAWAADVSEKGFSFKDALAIVPQTDYSEMSSSEKDSLFLKIQKERIISQELRQTAFDNHSTTDDHGMQITGLAQDQTGKDFLIVKNSWGTNGNECGGYFYCSIPYFRYKTTSIMIHKDAIPKEIRKKLGL